MKASQVAQWRDEGQQVAVISRKILISCKDFFFFFPEKQWYLQPWIFQKSAGQGPQPPDLTLKLVLLWVGLWSSRLAILWLLDIRQMKTWYFHLIWSTKTSFRVSREKLGAARFHPQLFRSDKLHLEGPGSFHWQKKASKAPGSGVGTYTADNCI